MKKDNITIIDLARETKTSIATVSRVITKKGYVKESTRIKIEDAIKKYNYKPNLIARSLNRKESNIIGFIIQNLIDPFYTNICSEAERYCTQNGFSTLIGDTQANFKIEELLIQKFIQNQVDGIIFFGGSFTHLKIPKEHIETIKEISQKCPIVLVNGSIKNIDPYIITTDEKKGLIKLIDYLVQCGHKKIGFLGIPKDSTSGTKRKQIFVNRLKELKLEVREEWIISGSLYSANLGSACMEKLLALKELPTALCCFNDITAFGAIKYAVKHNLKIPEDMSIVGFDNVPMSEFFIPGITTITQDFVSLGQGAVQKIIDLKNKKDVPKKTLLEPKLIIRDSCKKIN